MKANEAIKHFLYFHFFVLVIKKQTRNANELRRTNR